MVKATTIGYWTTTAIIAFVLLTGGLADLARLPETTAGVLALGYPLYFVTILGFWKILGALALLAPRFPRLKEWAYAGAFFNFSGAVASHAISHSGTGHVVWTAAFALCTLASWALRPQSRRLRSTSPAEAGPLNAGVAASLATRRQAWADTSESGTAPATPR